MSAVFELPDLGEGIHEGEVISVLVTVGDRVNEGDSIMEVETDKAAVEIPSPFTGTVSEIRVKPGMTVNVGDVMVVFEGTDAQGRDTGERPAPAAPPQPEPASPPSIRKAGPVPAAPSTRRLARELKVDLNQVPASGPGGIVTAKDVRSFAGHTAAAQPVSAEADSMAPGPPPAAQAEEALPDFDKWGPTKRVAFRSIRRSTARQVARAWAQIPHITTQDQVDITRLEAFRNRHKAGIEAQGGRLTLTVFALKAVATALKIHPGFNASLDLEKNEIVLKKYTHIGVATDTEDGLIVPVLRDVDRKSIRDLALELGDLIARTRSRKVKLEELKGGSFTITNIGHLGGGHFTPIINSPQVAIFGMGAARMQPMVMENKDGGHDIVPRLVMPVVLGMDHRVLDGADSIRFLRTVIDIMQDPEQMLLTMV